MPGSKIGTEATVARFFSSNCGLGPNGPICLKDSVQDVVMNCPWRKYPGTFFTGTANPLDFETLGHIIPDWCVPTLERNRAEAWVSLGAPRATVGIPIFAYLTRTWTAHPQDPKPKVGTYCSCRDALSGGQKILDAMFRDTHLAYCSYTYILLQLWGYSVC